MASAAARAEPRPRPRRRAVTGGAQARPSYELREERRNSPGRRATASRPRVAGGVVWIVLVAALLAGIVALNVAVLGLNMKVERLDAQRDQIQARNAAIVAELASVAAAGRIEAAARRRLGLVEPTETTYVEAGRPRR